MEQPAPTPTKRVSRGPTAAYGIVLAVLLFVVVLLPFAVTSVFGDITNQSETVYELTPKHSPDEEVRSNVHMQVIALNEWEGTASIRVSVHQTCRPACLWGDRILLVSTHGDTSDSQDRRPSSELVTLPANQRDVVQVIKLPVFGDPIRYPFDRYRLSLGVIAEHLYPDGRVETLTGAESREYLHLTLQGRIPRILMTAPESVDPATVQDDSDLEPYAVVEILAFDRPHYLRVLGVLLVLLVAAAAAYAVLLRPLDQLIINAGALVLGVWGVRSILLGTSLPGVTAVDLALTVVILFLLVMITVRTAYLLEEKSALRFLRHKQEPKGEAKPEAEAPPAGTPDYVPGRGPSLYPARKLSRTSRERLSTLVSTSTSDCQTPRSRRPPRTTRTSAGLISAGST